MPETPPDTLIDVTRLVERFLNGKIATGVDRIGLSYIAGFRENARALIRFGGRWVILSPRHSGELFDMLLRPASEAKFRVRALVAVSYVVNWRSHCGALLINVMHSGLEHSAYTSQVKKRGLRPLYFLHDLIPLTVPEYCRPGEAKKHARRVDAMLATARIIVVNSAQTGQELADYAARKDVSVPPVLCALLPPTELPRGAGTPLLDRPYFVMVCTIEPRKNHLLLLNLWRDLAHELGDAAPRLVLIGKRGWECEQVVDMLDRCPALAGLVIERSDCDDVELATWLAHARALLFPSFAEGYGMPVAEALAAGVPVIASDLPVFREISAGIPDYIPPLDAVSWKAALLDYAHDDSPRRARQGERLPSFKLLREDEYLGIVKDFVRRQGEYP